jgi:hypothetical protein
MSKINKGEIVPTTMVRELVYEAISAHCAECPKCAAAEATLLYSGNVEPKAWCSAGREMWDALTELGPE